MKKNNFFSAMTFAISLACGSPSVMAQAAGGSTKPATPNDINTYMTISVVTFCEARGQGGQLRQVNSGRTCWASLRCFSETWWSCSRLQRAPFWGAVFQDVSLYADRRRHESMQGSSPCWSAEEIWKSCCRIKVSIEEIVILNLKFEGIGIAFDSIFTWISTIIY